MIENPNYKGEWIHPLIANPDYVDDDNLYLYTDNKFVGIEVWQVKAGTIFDNFIVTDDLAEADKLAALTKATQEGEKKAFDKEEEERKAKEVCVSFFTCNSFSFRRKKERPEKLKRRLTMTKRKMERRMSSK